MMGENMLTFKSSDTQNLPARRDLLRLGSLGTYAWATSGGSTLTSVPSPLPDQSEQRQMLKARTGKPNRCPNCYGDVWTTTLADDDNLSAATDATFARSPMTGRGTTATGRLWVMFRVASWVGWKPRTGSLSAASTKPATPLGGVATKMLSTSFALRELPA